eukprot:9165-Heterococcus_DN1.PRE.2
MVRRVTADREKQSVAITVTCNIIIIEQSLSAARCTDHFISLVGVKTIKDVYGVDSSKLRIFVHYLPQAHGMLRAAAVLTAYSSRCTLACTGAAPVAVLSFFHFHVHFTSHTNQTNVLPEKAHLLQDIIQNLEVSSQYYTQRTMQYSIKLDDKLYSLLEPHIADSADI